MDRLFRSGNSDRTRGRGFRLTERRLTTEIRKEFFPVRVGDTATGYPDKLGDDI